MSNIQSTTITYNNQSLYVQYIREISGELNILTINKAPKYMPRIKALIEEIKEIVEKELLSEATNEN